MSSLNKSSFLRIFLSYLPITMLFFSVFNEFDFNYLKLDYFAFNFVHLLIFFWTLRNPDQLGYLAIFFAGIINDVVMGIPLGLSSLSYLVVSLVSTYVKNMTVNTSITTDWFTFFIAIMFSNLTFLILASNFSQLSIQIIDVSYNTFFTLIFFPFFWFIFNFYNNLIYQGGNV